MRTDPGTSHSDLWRAGVWITTPPELALRGIRLREEVDDDVHFLCELFISTRIEEMKVAPWPEEQKISFLVNQFQLQHKHYATYCPDAARHIVLVHGVPCGRIYLLRMGAEVRIVDIALAPAWRGQGIGGELLREMLKCTAAIGGFASIHVEHQNPARRLYERLGFELVEDLGVYLLMHCHPAVTATSRAVAEAAAEPVIRGSARL